MSDQLEEALDRAYEEKGEIVGRVYCGLCGPKGLGVIRLSSHGLYFEADLVTGTTKDPVIVASQKARARSAGVRLPFLGPIGRCRYLLELDPVDQDYPPRAECPRHGRQDLDPRDLVAVVRGRQTPRAAIITIHQSADA